uniref:sigma-70 family RNA polymerase sigma factor n=1 Tax=Clostridium sp. NkU-1 TaxID=1095009 RepID=UPI000B246554
MIKVSRSIKEMGLKVKNVREELVYRLGREPTVEEIAGEIGASKEEVAASIEAGAEVESLYRSVNKNDENSILLIDKIEEESSAQEDLLNRMVLRELLTALSDKDREIIIRRYYYNETQSQIAAKLGISQVQVSRLEKRF